MKAYLFSRHHRRRHPFVERLFGDFIAKVEDEGWRAAAVRYRKFLDAHRKGKILYLELGVGANTPVIIKYPFWRSVYENPQAVYACVNYGEAFVPNEIRDRSILVDADIDAVLDELPQVSRRV